MAELRARRPVKAVPAKQQQEEEEEEDKSKSKPLQRQDVGPDLEPNFFVVLGLIVIFFVALGTLVWYKVDNREGGAFAAWVNKKYPAIDRALNKPSTPIFGAAAQKTTGSIKLTEEELKAYDGTDADKPIYLAIDGTIFDVSSSPAFYGPGGHYHHFVGKDATRAWITECWDEPEQFTWRLDDVEVMFMNKYLDEQLEAAGAGDFAAMGDLGESAQKMMVEMAKKALQKVGSVTDNEKKKRRQTDLKEANEKVKDTLQHWKSFFQENQKYKTVGEVILDETRPAPPEPCKKAMEKRPVKGGKLESLMGAGANIMGGGAGKDKAAAGKGSMPDFVKAMQEDKKKKEQAKVTGKAKEEEEVVEEEEDGEDGDDSVDELDLADEDDDDHDHGDEDDEDDDVYHEEL